MIFHFYGDSDMTFYDTLAFTVQNGITWRGGKPIPLSDPGTLYVNVKGLSTPPPASVATVSAPNANLQLYPNPSSGIVNMQLDGSENTTFEVFDVLGNIIASHTG